MRFKLILRRVRTPLLGVVLASAAAIVSAQPLADPAREAVLALDRYLETWNSRTPALWASSLHYPHVRPGAGPFEVSQTAAEYAAGVNFEQTLRTGWHHSEWVSRTVLQTSASKVHVAGTWQRFTADGTPQTSSAITYIVSNVGGRWGVLARFAAGTGTIDAVAQARNSAAGLQAVTTFFTAWNSHDPQALAASLHYPHVRIADGQVEVWRAPQAILTGAEAGRQRTWYQTRVDKVAAVQTTSNGVNLTVTLSRLGRDGTVLSTDEGVFLVALREGSWKVQARSMMGT